MLEVSRQLEAELKAAQEAAALAQAAGAAGSAGQMEAGPFDLPNPGGGENLANGCTFNLMPGGASAFGS